MKKKEEEKFIKLFIGFFIAVTIIVIFSNPQEVLDGFIDALK